MCSFCCTRTRVWTEPDDECLGEEGEVTDEFQDHRNKYLTNNETSEKLNKAVNSWRIDV